MENALNFSDFFTDATTNKLSESKLWAHVAKGAATFGFIHTILFGTPTEWLWIAYLGPLLAHEGYARWQTSNSQPAEAK